MSPSIYRRKYLAKLQRDKWMILSARVLLLVFIFAMWEIAANLGWIDPFIMSSPSRVWDTVLQLYTEGELFYHIGISCLEAVIGFVAGTVLGTLVATALWWSPTVNKVLEPYLVVLNSLPKIALGPIFIVWMGVGVEAIIAITLAISLVVTVLEVLGGFTATDTAKLKLMKTLHAGKFQTFTKVVLPSNYPTIINALKINVGLSWVGVIVGEFLVSRAGLGYLTVYGSAVFQMDLVMASVLILAVAAAVMYQGVLLLEKALIRH